MPGRRSRTTRSTSPFLQQGRGYLDRTRRPIYSLYFLLPILILYELGVMLAYPSFAGEPAQEVMARYMLNWFMSLFGVTGVFLPGLIVVLVLLGWHLYRKDPWQVDRDVLVGMAAESVLLALPMLLFHALLAARAMLADTGWADAVLLSMSAGIYEELVFRLFLISLLTWFLAEVVGLKRPPASAVAVVVSSLIFALHHCQGFGGAEAFRWDYFIFRSAAGLYLAGVFVLRGFGIAVGCHTVYDIIVVTAAR